MQFTADAWDGLADGSITMTFRTWRKPLAKAGSVHRVAGGIGLVIDAVDRVSVGRITATEAKRAGAASRAALLERLGSPAPGDEVWRIAFHRDDAAHGANQTAAPTDDDVERILARLARLDHARAEPWTERVLRLIADCPARVSTDLAATLGRPRAAFKADVRKLKVLGLTESLERGYRLSERGESVLAALSVRRAAAS